MSLLMYHLISHSLITRQNIYKRDAVIRLGFFFCNKLCSPNFRVEMVGFDNLIRFVYVSVRAKSSWSLVATHKNWQITSCHAKYSNGPRRKCIFAGKNILESLCKNVVQKGGVWVAPLTLLSKYESNVAPNSLPFM